MVWLGCGCHSGCNGTIVVVVMAVGVIVVSNYIINKSFFLLLHIN